MRRPSLFRPGSTTAISFVFLHGGPGFNSFAERAILGPLFADANLQVVFWNEPSRLRPDGEPFHAETAFEHWLASARRCVMTAWEGALVHLIAHSCTIHPAVAIARDHPERVRSLILVAPSADNLTTFRNVLRLAHADLVGVKPEPAATVADSLERTRRLMDEAMREGMLAAVNDDRLFTHYFVNEDRLRAMLATWSRPEAQFDLESFLSVLSDFGNRGGTLLPGAALSTPTLALFGAQDPVTPAAEHAALLRNVIPDVHVEIAEGCSHYVHLEQPQRFVDRVIDWTASLDGTHCGAPLR
jgi:pimeloyl-ACP methyl ester carboxylesterase